MPSKGVGRGTSAAAAIAQKIMPALGTSLKTATHSAQGKAATSRGAYRGPKIKSRFDRTAQYRVSS